MIRALRWKNDRCHHERLSDAQPNEYYRQHIPFLRRVVSRLVQEHEMADDIVQQTMLRAAMNAHKFRFESSLKTWLTSIAINEVRQAYRCSWHKRNIPLTAEDIDFISSQTLESSSNGYQAKERDNLVRMAVSRLPQEYRCVIELCDLQQVPMREAAKQLALTIPALKSRRHRAKQKLMPLLKHLRVSPRCCTEKEGLERE
jgi:RNA polymerase sigma-70 factor, ECF subfamily